jgi:isochorismate hydrolase
MKSTQEKEVKRMLDREKAVLIVVDIQGNLAAAMYEKEFLFENAEKIIRGVQLLGVPVLVTEQIKLGPTIPALARYLPGVNPIVKDSFSCCGDERFMRELTALSRGQILMTGIEAHVCAYQTSMDLIERGFEVHLVADAVSSRTARNREIGIQKLIAAGAVLTSTEMALFELLKTAADSRAKDLFKIIK